MSDNSTQTGDVSTSESGFDNPMDDAIDTLLDRAVERGTLSPAFDNEEEVESIQEEDESTEELEGEDLDHAEEDAEDVDDDNEDSATEEEDDEDDDESIQQEESDEVVDGELDMDYLVPVKVDGEKSEVTIEELIKGYQTNQSQTKKGQELAEQAKQLDAEIEKSHVFQKINDDLLKQQDDRDLALLQSKKDVMDKMAKDGFVEGVDDDLATLQYKYKSLEDEYDRRKTERNSTTDKMLKVQQEEVQKQAEKNVESFQKEIVTLVPDWTEAIAQSNYKFAIEQGIPEEFVNTIVSPVIAKFIDDYRRLKTSASTGAKKRKLAPVKTVSAKKPASKQYKTKTKSVDARKRITKGKASDKDYKVLNDDVYDSIFDNSELFN
jgi:hypothetical protein|tara:strand:- start:298 stop:1434 length:1137 start_codon:yes stop_codon:yes gene_type:complete